MKTEQCGFQEPDKTLMEEENSSTDGCVVPPTKKDNICREEEEAVREKRDEFVTPASLLLERGSCSQTFSSHCLQAY